MDATPAVPTAPRIPTGPRGLPLLGVALDIQRDILGWLTRTAAELPPLDPDALCVALLERLSATTEDDIALLAVRV